MAVYRFADGVFERLAGSLDEMATDFAAWGGSVGEYAARQGMVLLDDVDGVYELYARQPGVKAFSRLSAYRWWFRMVDGLDAVDDVLIADALPDFLDYMSRVEPLVSRVRHAAREVGEAVRP